MIKNNSLALISQKPKRALQKLLFCENFVKFFLQIMTVYAHSFKIFELLWAQKIIFESLFTTLSKEV